MGERNALMARIAAVRWFRALPHGVDASARIADALERHIRLLGITPAPRELAVLTRDEGLAEVRARPALLARSYWEQRLTRSFEHVTSALLTGSRVDGDPLFSVSGRSVLLETTVLPLPQDLLLGRLMDARGYALDAASAQRLLDRLLWELGAMLAAELVGDLVGENPFKPLLDIHEEGLILLDITPERVTLWA